MGLINGHYARGGGTSVVENKASPRICVKIFSYKYSLNWVMTYDYNKIGVDTPPGDVFLFIFALVIHCSQNERFITISLNRPLLL